MKDYKIICGMIDSNFYVGITNKDTDEYSEKNNSGLNINIKKYFYKLFFIRENNIFSMSDISHLCYFHEEEVVSYRDGLCIMFNKFKFKI